MLLFAPAPGNAIRKEDRNVRREARTDRRVRVMVGPLKHPGQARPVALIPQVRRPRLGNAKVRPIEVA